MLRSFSVRLKLSSGTVYKRSIRTVSEVSGVKERNSSSHIYDQVLNDLKERDSYGFTPSLNLHNKLFTQLGDTKNEIKEKVGKQDEWVTSYDYLTKTRWAQDISYLESLLDALIQNKNFVRARNILDALQPLLKDNEQTLIYCINNYLLAYSKESSTTYSDITNFINSIETDFEVKPDDRTYAIYISKYEEKFDEIIKSLRQKEDSEFVRNILTHIDVLGDDLILKILHSETIYRTEVPEDLLALYDQAQKRRSNNIAYDQENLENENDLFKEEEDYLMEDIRATNINNENVGGDYITEQNNSNQPELLPVSSFNLRVIKHSLSGLEKTNEEFVETFLRKLGNESVTPFYTNERINYFEMYKTLKSDEERKNFNDLLESINFEREKILELKGADAAKERWKHSFEEMKKNGTLPNLKSLNVQLFKWYQDLLPLVEAEYNLCKELIKDETSDSSVFDSLESKERQIVKDKLYYSPYFTLNSPLKMCVITILELLKLNTTGGVADGMRLTRAVMSVGKALEMEYRAQKVLQQEKDQKKSRKRSIKELRDIVKRRRFVTGNKNEEMVWKPDILVKLGEILVSNLLNVAKIPVHGVNPNTGAKVIGLQPAILHNFQFMNGQRVGVLKLHKELVQLLSGDNDLNVVQPQHLPMLVRPNPWTSYYSGGYLLTNSPIVRTKDLPETVAYLKTALDQGRLDGVFDGLNVIGDTPWTINAQILKVITEVWNTGEEFLEIPGASTNFELPPAPPPNADPKIKVEYRNIVKKLFNEASSKKSNRCDTNYKLEIARGFIGEKIYFPNNLDFRGRAYPISPHLNHLGNDLTRSLFLFWEGKKLGEVGLRWLKIHFANVYGLDKAPLNERLEFTDNNLEQIFASAKDPLGEGKFWLKAEKPWLALSVAMELNQAYQLENPEEYVSHVPVHQDGTCNGLQHYAALGGDVIGAKSVNLIPQDRPQDVYKYVALLVQKKIDQEASEGNETAIFLQDKLTRKVVKQTVMTNVYGVTYIGAVAQIEKQIIHHFEPQDIAAKVPHKMSTYLATHVFNSMRQLFYGAHSIQDWLGICARKILKSINLDFDDLTMNSSKGKPNFLSLVIWTTQLGLNCVQPYRVTSKQKVDTSLQDIGITDPFGPAPIDARKQQVAFPPNFVHSLDATHMLKTASACGNSGITFASVHDSFWTHACDVDIMNVNCREQFIDLHKTNLILKLKEEFEERYKGAIVVAYVDSKNPFVAKIAEVRKSISKQLGRSLSLADEIYLEKRRQELLNLKDPSEIEMGQNMVTTISVAEEIPSESLLDVSKSSTTQVLVPLKFPDVPPRGDFDIEIIKDSPYFFS